ncbi:unnamed protein product (macronuclear) [Paramecium tetraurelia]|uniref:Uncharacterized protein n=1 Tax=Paramecium tetraurelia TaxID=5888 RepID=A0E2I9_PARTE|nr:uncharacterized protein GSPATT00022678001 [Paramecium tetraurelia]CAK89506.1 unnamed protein product [Paramecium tetraurelia]|eukprot:XP_001456903.1 hypothetical protein (macronuclear) [Paramecium tetraurelia strain d4-2]
MMQNFRNIINVPSQIVEITKISKTKGDVEEMISPESDQEVLSCSTPQSNYMQGEHDSKTKRKKKHIRFSFQNQVCSCQLNSNRNSPTDSPRLNSPSIQSILKPQSLSMFCQKKK